ncbi:MAG: hypothetical protein NC124_19480 [Clostridium sp.]|nr:hypothetical protein [Clostridium sp.]
MKIKKNLPLVMLGILLLIPITANASMKSVSLTTKDKSASASCSCAVATVQGGAMIGGDGINYDIGYKKSTLSSYTTLKSGSCKSNTSFTKYNFSSPTGYSVTLRLKETQKNSNNPGIGWGRIDY